MATRTRETGERVEGVFPYGELQFSEEMLHFYPRSVSTRDVTPTVIGQGVICDTRKSITDSCRSGRRNNGCSHDKRFPFALELPTFVGRLNWSDGDFPSYETWYRTKGTMSSVSGSYTIDSHLGESGWPDSFDVPIDWSSHVTEVGNRLDGSMKASTNVLVILGELAETVAMLKNPFGLLTTNWSRRLAGSGTLRQHLKAGANIWLEKKYGWDNFIRDFDAMSKALHDADAHIQYLQSSLGKSVSNAARQFDAKTYTPPIEVIGSAINGIAVKVTSLRAERVATFSADLLRGEHYRILSRGTYARQRVGSGLLIPALWDLVPMSFVVDWFVDVQRYLKTSLAYSGAYDIRNVCYSTKITWFASLEITRKIMLYGGVAREDVQVIHEIPIRELYTRNVGFPPSTESAGIFSGLNLTHLADAAALIGQRVL